MKFTANAIASLIGGKVEGDGDVEVTTFAKIEEGIPGAISFLANPKYTHYIYETRSSIVLVSNDFVAECPIGATLIRVENPYETVAKLLEMVQAATMHLPTGIETPSYISEGVELPEDVYIGAFAYVGKNVKLGKGVKLYPQTYIGDNVNVGEGTIIYPGAKVYHSCKIGRHCIIHAGVVIGADGFGFAPDSAGVYNKIPQMGIVEIGDNVEIGANTTIDRATMGATRIAKGVKLDNLIQVAHNVEIGQNTVMASQVGVAGSTKIGSQCMIGGQVGFAGHITVGDGVSIGAQSGIPNNVKDGATLMGYPALPGREFARQCAYLKRLGKLFERVEALEKENKNK